MTETEQAAGSIDFERVYTFLENEQRCLEERLQSFQLANAIHAFSEIRYGEGVREHMTQYGIQKAGLRVFFEPKTSLSGADILSIRDLAKITVFVENFCHERMGLMLVLRQHPESSRRRTIRRIRITDFTPFRVAQTPRPLF